MKKYIWIVIGLLISLFVCSCDNDYEKMYSGDGSLYFNLTTAQMDSISYSFVGIESTKIMATIPVEITGYAMAEARPFRLKVNSARTTAVAGKDYEALKEEYVLENGKYGVQIPLTLLYSRELDTRSVRLVLELDGGEVFAVGIPNRQEVTIVFSNEVPDMTFWGRNYAPDFGSYSKVKHRYMLSELKLEKLEESANPSLDWTLWAAYGQYMSNFFATHEIYDEHDQRIEPWIN